jgi:hypothetical protein
MKIASLFLTDWIADPLTGRPKPRFTLLGHSHEYAQSAPALDRPPVLWPATGDIEQNRLMQTAYAAAERHAETAELSRDGVARDGAVSKAETILARRGISLDDRIGDPVKRVRDAVRKAKR